MDKNNLEKFKSLYNKFEKQFPQFEKLNGFKEVESINKTMNKKLKDYLHLYLGCKIKTPQGFRPNGNESTGKPGEAYLTADLLSDITKNIYQVREQDFLPILRLLSDLTEQECKELDWSYGYNEEKINHKPVNLFPHEIIFLLKNGFDLFGLIESGLAIDQTKLKQ